MIFLIASLGAAILTVATPEVELRAQQIAPPGRIVAVEPAGILVAPLDPGDPAAAPGAPTLIIGWDRIRRINGEFAEQAERYAPIADMAWRARTRLERGDAFAAEPLFERLFEQYGPIAREGSGATAAVITEGLLRCRLRRGAHIGAIEPWLAFLHITDSPPAFAADWAQQADLPPVIDPATSLIPALPPMWLSWPALEAFARAGLPESSEGQPGTLTQRAPAMAALYLHAARIEAGLESTSPQIRSSDPGIHLVLAVVQARSPDPELRKRARQRLHERMRSTPASANPTPLWVEAWCRAAIGRSLVREAAVEQRRLGILELLHLPARFAASHPYLAGLALAEAAITLRELGDNASADILMRELADKYPTHPVHDWRPTSRAARGHGALQEHQPMPDLHPDENTTNPERR